MSELRCFYCEEPLDPVAVRRGLTVWQAVWGWEQRAGKRASGHPVGSDIYLRQRFERFAHASCVKLARAGVSPRQGTLV